MLVVPSASGMNQNQPCSNQKIVMLPSSLPGSRSAPVKWPYSAELLWRLFFSLQRSWLASSVSRPEASTTKRARQRAPRAVVELDLDGRAVAVELDLAHALALEGARALGGGVAEQDLVELGAAHLPGVRHRLVPGLAELDELAMLVVGRDELDAVLRHADRLDPLAHAEPVEQGDVGRQQRLADVKARVARLLDDDDVAALLGEQRGDGRAGRAAADDEHVAIESRVGRGRLGGGSQGLHGAGFSSRCSGRRGRLRRAACPSIGRGF